MSEQKKAPKIEDSVILSAIEKVKEKGFDINPYTVSDEAKVFPSDIFRAPGLMKIILDARDEASKWHFQPSTSEADIKFNTLEINLDKLREENERLNAQLNELEEKLTAPTDSSTHVDVVVEAEAEQNDNDNNFKAKSKSDSIKKTNKESDVDFSLEEDFNEQFKDLLQMESESQVQDLENQLADLRNELSQAQSEIARVEDDNKDLSHSVLGLERVNEALNIRLRELEVENRDLKAVAENEAEEKITPSLSSSDENNNEELQNLRNSQQELQERLNHFEDENARLIGRIQDLENEAEQKEMQQANQSQANPELEAYVQELEQRITDYESKQVEMQEELDTLVTQLQNSWHTGYQKGLSDGKAQAAEEAASAAPQQIQIEPAAINYDATAPVQAQAFQAPDLSMLQGMGSTSSEYDALKDMKWKDVETVYQMGGQAQAAQNAYHENTSQEHVLGENFEQNYEQPYEQGYEQGYEQSFEQGGYQQAGFEQGYTENDQASYGQPQEEVAYDFGAGYQNYDEQENVQDLQFDNSFQQGEYAQEHGEYQDAHPQYEQQQIHQQAAPEAEIDFDQMDIFEDMEELERLGKIELPDDIIPIDHNIKATPSEAELRNLVQNKIHQQHEQNTGEVPRLVGKAAAAEAGQAQTDLAGAKGINKFVGQRGAHASSEAAQSATNLPVVRNVPPEVRKACQILGLAPESMTKETISDAWKKAITAPGVHPDQGGDTEIATSINLAKATLLKFMDQTAPKLGKKFPAQSSGGATRFAGKKKPEAEDQE